MGSVFYWSIGYKTVNGQLIKTSILRFQRILDWDEERFDKAADRASKLFNFLNGQR